MPPLTRWHIRAALIYFVAASLIGAAMALRSFVVLPDIIGALNPVYFHLFMVGWVTQLILGVVYWMFPKFSLAKPRGSEALGWATFTLLNLGLLLRAIGEPLAATQPSDLASLAIALSAVLQWLAGMSFVANTWNRVKEK